MRGLSPAVAPASSPPRPAPPASAPPASSARAKPSRRPRARLGPATLALLAAGAAGCADVIGLGPEATRRADDPPPPVDVTSCGLPPHPRADCTACAETSCCAETQACAAEAGCGEEAACAIACTFDTTCIANCSATYKTAAYATLQLCQLTNCLARCLPPEACFPLVNCCQRAPEGALRDACTGPVNQGSEQGCRDAIAIGVLDPYCPELADAK